MNEVMVKFIILSAIGYIVGSIPAGMIIAKIKGVDLTKIGSGSYGSTNVTRALGKKYGYLVFAIDALKAAIIGIMAKSLLMPEEIYFLIVLGFVLLGNSYSAFLKFKGGKGVATAFGLIVAVNFWVALICLAVWIFAFKVTKTVSTAGLIAIPVATIVLLILKEYNQAIFAILTYIFIAYRHKSNISRIIKGEENSFKKEK
jgi:glycerol-3-phosphate acyltransferase PlsY